ncbi:MAG: hypothetical protein Aurels2KO_14330 [Aureliella sp.]
MIAFKLLTPGRLRLMSSAAMLLLATVCATEARSEGEADKEPTETTFIVVRHAEREGNQDKLSAQGEARAETIRSLGTALRVSAIYSTNTERTKNTVKPLGEALKLKTQLYGRITRNWPTELEQANSGGVVLIVGHSNTTGVIAGLLADKPAFPIGHDEYDAMFIVTRRGSESNCVRLKFGVASGDNDLETSIRPGRAR